MKQKILRIFFALITISVILFALASPVFAVALGVTTFGYNSITSTTANLIGQVTGLDTDNSATCSFEYGTTVSYGSNSSTTVEVIGLYNLTIIALTPNTLYHFRAKIVGIPSGSTVYGADSTFTTTVTTTTGNNETFVSRTSTYAYQTGTVNVAQQLGARTQAAFQGVALYFLGDASKDGMLEASWGMLLVLMCASIVFLGTGSSTIALVSSVPMVLIAVWVGAFPMVILWLILACVVLYIGYHFALRGM